MAKPAEKLAQSLEKLKELQDQGLIAIQANELSRIHRERLVNSGFLQEIIKGWYTPTRPDEPVGESTVWYAAFWPFCVSYLTQRFGEAWCLSPEQSLAIHAGNWTVPRQLMIRSPRGNNKATPLPHNTSLFDARYAMPNPEDIIVKDNIRIYSLAAALIAVPTKYFSQNPTDLRASLSGINNAAELLDPLLAGEHSVIAGRLAGALRNIGRTAIADEILTTMRTAGYKVREEDPFTVASPIYFSDRKKSPYVSRMQLLWQAMRQPVIDNFPTPPKKKLSKKTYLKLIDDIYVTDAYHSLSIEGYKVSAELIEHVRSGSWDPDQNNDDREHRNALAARGYWLAFQKVKQSIEKVLPQPAKCAEIAEHDHHAWYRELFGPSVTAGILTARDLAGYRNGAVYIRRSMHVPPSHEAVRDLMPAFFDLLNDEDQASARVVLGHFFFVYIHPYMDGNGRMGRFLMNLMLASGKYPWMVVPVERRLEYLSSLEMASVENNIVPFCKFLASLL